MVSHCPCSRRGDREAVCQAQAGPLGVSQDWAGRHSCNLSLEGGWVESEQQGRGLGDLRVFLCSSF